MSALTPWDPFRELDELQNRLATMFGRIPQRQGARTGNEALTTADWAPMVDISEDENAFLLKLDLPEVPKDAVRVSAENGVLTISGERSPSRRPSPPTRRAGSGTPTRWAGAPSRWTC